MANSFIIHQEMKRKKKKRKEEKKAHIYHRQLDISLPGLPLPPFLTALPKSGRLLSTYVRFISSSFVIIILTMIFFISAQFVRFWGRGVGVVSLSLSLSLLGGKIIIKSKFKIHFVSSFSHFTSVYM